MPIDYLPNTATQLERAIRAWLQECGAVGPLDCFISNDSRDRSAENAPLDKGITDIMALSSNTTEAEDSGNEKFVVRISTKFGAIVSPDEPNPAVNRVECDKRVGKLMLAMSDGKSSDMRLATALAISTAGRDLANEVDSTDAAVQDAANNADMAEFTCLSVRYLGMTRGQPDDRSCAWIEVRNFEISACPSNVD